MKYVQPFDKPAAPTAPYVDLNAATGVDGSIPPAKFFNDIQAEVLNVIVDAGLIPDPNDMTQLLQAINKRLNGMTFLPVGAQFYVNASTGNDGNNGLTAGTAFATLQGAVNVIAAKYVSLSGVTVNVANGTYNGFTVVSSLISSWTFLGNIASPSSVIVNATTTAVNEGRACRVNNAVVALRGLRISGLYNCLEANRASVTVQECALLGVGATSVGLGSYNASRVTVNGAISMSGTFSVLLTAQNSSFMEVAFAGFPPISAALTISAATTVAQFALASTGGSIVFSTSQITITGAGLVTGQRYACFMNGTIETFGSGATYLPGTTAGTTATGSQYA